MFADPQHFVDSLQTVEFDEQRSATRHENETKKQRAVRETRGDLHTTVQGGFDLGIGTLSRRFSGLRDGSVFLRGDRRLILLVTFDFTEGT